jgi:hypothetical protein
VYYNCCSWIQSIYWAWKHTVYHIAMFCYVMCNLLGNIAFIIFGVVGHGSSEDYHTEMVWFYVRFIIINIYYSCFCKTWGLRVLAHRNIITFKLSCIEVK